MTRAVWKFELPIRDEVTVAAPLGADLQHVGAQGDKLCLWALVDPAAEMTDYTFYVRGTGQPVPDGVIQAGTAQIGSFVWHVFERSVYEDERPDKRPWRRRWFW